MSPRVRALYVSDGERVHAGQVLVELDATQIDSEREKSRKDREAAALQAAARERCLPRSTRGCSHACHAWRAPTRPNDAKEDEAGAQARANLYILVAPIDGTVQQLTVHTIGGVVPSAQPLMQIVPTRRVIEMDAGEHPYLVARVGVNRSVLLVPPRGL